MDKINFFNTYIDKTAKEEVCKVLDTTFISAGQVADKFEKKLEDSLSTTKILTVNSGTSALHLSLVLAGVRQGDEVILPSQTFIASALTIMMQGAKPVFCDINYDDGNIDVDKIENLITEKTKAIMPVHWSGLACDMDEINRISEKYNLKVVADGAHSLGTYYKGVPIGKTADYTCLSFQAIKHLTTGDGGAVIVKTDEDYIKGKKLRWFGLDRENSLPSELGERQYDVVDLGFKYHLNDFSSSLGIANLKTFKDRLNKRSEIVEKYDKELSKIAGINLFNKNKYQNKSANWLYGMHVENRIEFIRKMKSNNIPVSVVHQGIHKNSIFKDVVVVENLENQLKFDETQIHLPLHDALTMEQVNYIIENIQKGW